MIAKVENLSDDRGRVSLYDAETGTTWSLVVTAERRSSRMPAQAANVGVHVERSTAHGTDGHWLRVTDG